MREKVAEATRTAHEDRVPRESRAEIYIEQNMESPCDPTCLPSDARSGPIAARQHTGRAVSAK